MISIKKSEYGKLSTGQVVTLYELRNSNGMEVHCLDFGCIINRIIVPDRTGAMIDVVLGHKDLAGYESGRGYYGAFIGRYANRIKGAEFSLDGKDYKLLCNSNGNFLHGSFSKRLFNCELTESGLLFSYLSPDGEDGFPGNLLVSVRYSLKDNNELLIEYSARTDKKTVVSFTNHSYFNLDGHDSGNIYGQYLKINADKYLICDKTLCPTGEIGSVHDGIYDFREYKKISEDIDSELLSITNGYDNCFVLNDSEWAAKAYSKNSGIALEIRTSAPGLQFYSGGGTASVNGKDEVVYCKHAGFALEAQQFPCSPNISDFPDTVLDPGDIYQGFVSFAFSNC